MKTLIYSMQNSGASLFAYWLAQKENSICVLDLYPDFLAPHINNKNAILKCVVTNKFKLEEHIDSFKPDKIIFFIRNPIENHLRLYEKIYASYGGSIEEKTSILNSIVEQKKYDELIKYEDFIYKRIPDHIGPRTNYNFEKSLDKIKEYNFKNNQWCRDNYRKQWGIGNIHVRKLKILNDLEKIKNLYDLYK